MISNIIKKTLGKSALKIGGGLAAYAGANAIADRLEGQLPGGVQIGGAYTSALRLAGSAAAIYGIGSGVSGTVRGAGQALMAGSGWVPSKYQNSAQSIKMHAVGRKLSRFSLTKKLFTKTSWSKLGSHNPAKSLAKGIASIPIGIAKAPFVVANDLLLGAPARALPNKIGNVLRKSHGARAFGWGATLGAARLGAEVSYADNAKQSSANASLRFGGEQFWNPSSGGKARKTMDGSTEGLTLALHKLR